MNKRDLFKEGAVALALSETTNGDADSVAMNSATRDARAMRVTMQRLRITQYISVFKEEVEKRALDLPETERAPWRHTYWDRFHRSCTTKNEGIAEALRRDAEFKANPSLGMTLKELDQRIENRRS